MTRVTLTQMIINIFFYTGENVKTREIEKRTKKKKEKQNHKPDDNDNDNNDKNDLII